MKKPLLSLILCVFYAIPAYANTYEVGPGQTYPSLETLRNAAVLMGGDSLSLTALASKTDATLTAPLYTGSGLITFTANSAIATVFSPAASIKTNLFSNSTPNPLALLAANNLSINFNNFTVTGNGGTINSTGDLTLGSSSPGAGSMGFTASKATGGGAVYVRNGNNGTFTIAGGTVNFFYNAATSNGGAVYARLSAVLSGGTSTFSHNSAAGSGGALYLSTGAGALDITGGSHSFINNTAGGSGGALYNNGYNAAAITLNTTSGSLVFTGNTAGVNGGAIAADIVNIQSGSNTFTGNSTSSTNGGSGGAVYGQTNVNISGGTNTFTNNYSGLQGGGIYAGDTLTISGGTNVFTGNTALENGGAINSNANLTIDGGANTFRGNSALGVPGSSSINGQGGAVYAEQSALFRAKNGNISFAGNRDHVNRGSAKANALYMHNHLTPAVTQNTLTLAGTGNGSLFFYDPIVSRDKNSAGTPLSLNIAINPDSTDTGTVRFDGAYWLGQGSVNAADYATILYGHVNQSYGNIDVANNANLFISGNYTLANNAILNLSIISGAPTVTIGGTADLSGKVNITGHVSENPSIVLQAQNKITNLTPADITVNGKAVVDVDYVDSLTATVSPDETELSVQIGLTWNKPAGAHGTFTVENGEFSIGIGLADNTAGNYAAGWDGKNLTKGEAGTLNLAGNNTYTGNTVINEGTLAVTGLLGADSAGTSGVYSGDISIGSGGTLFMYQSKNQMLSGIISGAGALSAGGGGTLTLAGSNSYTGNTSLTDGILAVTGVLGTGGAYAGAISLGRGSTLWMSQGVNQTLSGTISGSGGLIKTGANTLTLAGNTSFTGNTSLMAGTLALSGTASLAQSHTRMAGNTTLDISGSTTTPSLASLSLTGAATLITGTNTLDMTGADFSFSAGALSESRAALQVTGTGAVAINGANMRIYGEPAQLAVFKKGHTYTLISHSTGTAATTRLVLTTLLVDYTLSLSDTTGALLITCADAQGSANSKVFGEGWLGGMAALTNGADILAGEGIRGAQRAAIAANGHAAAFGAVSGYSFKHSTGSHINANGAALLAGLAWHQANGLTYGVFAETGNSSYGTHNTLSNGQYAKGSGNTHYYGAGLLARMEMAAGSGLAYAEASARAGSLRNSFYTANLHAGFVSTMPYYGLHVGAGYQFSLSEKTALDFYGKYFWTYQDARHISLSTGDPIHYKAVNSHRLRLGARMDFALGEHFAPYIGAAWEYEFNGNARAVAYGVNLLAPSLKGSTFVGELGLSLKSPKVQGFSIDLGVQGFAGKRQGISGNLMLKYTF